MSTFRDMIERRLRDLRGGDKEKQGLLVEATAARMAFDDLMTAAEIAREVAIHASVNKAVEPTIGDVMSINQLYMAYLGPAYQTLVQSGEIPPPSVPTTPSSVTPKEDLVS